MACVRRLFALEEVGCQTLVLLPFWGAPAAKDENVFSQCFKVTLYAAGAGRIVSFANDERRRPHEDRARRFELMGLIALIAFWVAVIRLWIVEGPKLPLVFIGLWFAGLVAFRALGWPAYLFMSFEAILAATVLIVAQYKSAL